MSKGIRRSFPETFKREAVERVRTSGLSIKAVAVELGVHETVLRKWVRAHSGAQATGAVTRPITQRRPRRRLTWPPRTPDCGERMNACAWSATY